ncbi:putative glutathione-dependent formaldehyde-activating enzyme protein [Rhypophila sp. PSN 637]
MLLQCQCASISISIPNPDSGKDIPLYICHCTQCRRQSSSLFGTSAIFPASIIFPLSDDLKAKLSVWARPTKEGRSMDCYFCNTCGSRLMHLIREPDGLERETVSLKGGCLVESNVGNGKEKVPALDFSKATHLYTTHAVMDLETWLWPGAKRWEGSPEVMEGRPGSPSKPEGPANDGTGVGDEGGK